jgi:hypothetical protein
VWIARGRGPADVDGAVAAAAELLARLGDVALRLPVDARAWDTERPGFFVGPEDPPPADGATTRSVPLGGAAVARVGAGLLMTAPDGASLVAAVAAWLTVADAAEGPCRRSVGFAASGGAPEALGVALRHALATLPPVGRVVVPFDAAAVRTVVDAGLEPDAWEVRRRRWGDGERLEVAGHDAAALGHACRWFAGTYPRLPDGRWLDDVDDDLTRFVRAATREGRIGALAAVVAACAGDDDPPTHAEAPSPPADAARVLGLPIRNSARDGALRRWSTRIPWEGERLLDAAVAGLAGLPPQGGAITIEAYASEGRSQREALAERLSAAALAAGVIPAEVRVRHAFRPALHWLLEEVLPGLPEASVGLRVRASRPPGTAAADADGVPERWLRELHPVAELIESERSGLRVDVELGPERSEPSYTADATDAGGRFLASWQLEPPVAASPLSDGGFALSTTGGVRLRRDGAILAEAVVATDADALWRWFVGEVLPDLIAGLDPTDMPPFHELAVVAALSEPDDRLPLDHETDSVTESLHEDLYFGVLEAFQPRGAAARRTSPGRILPFVRAAPGEPTRAQVVLRAWGSGRTGLWTARGAWVEALACDVDARVTVVEGRGEAVVGLVVEVGSEDGLRRLAWAARVRPSLFPAAVPIRLRVAAMPGVAPGPGAAPGPGVGRAGAADREPPAVGTLGPFAVPSALPLPPRPLHPREAIAAGRALAARAPAVRFRTPLESGLGQPLGVLEIGPPEGPAASQARRAAWLPGVLLSARQHANEATSTQAAFAWLDRLLADGTLTRRANLVVHPLENPDGARLHAALCALAPHHMHHAARYTAFGADLQADPLVRGELIPESRLRHEAARRWRPQLHLNDHGYPAHGWVRAQTGHVPRGFADWSLPVGHLTILITHGPDAAEAAALREALAAAAACALAEDAAIGARTRAQVRRSGRYRAATGTPFVFRSGLPFWSLHRPPPDGGPAPEALAPQLTLITEVPDETVAGEAWEACVRSHALVNEAVTLRFLSWLSDRA